MNRVEISHREQNEISLDLEFAVPNLEQLAVLPLDSACDQRLEPPAVAAEFLGLHGPIALATFLVRRRGPQLHGPVRPDQRLVLVLRRLRQQLELRDRSRALAV